MATTPQTVTYILQRAGLLYQNHAVYRLHCMILVVHIIIVARAVPFLMQVAVMNSRLHSIHVIDYNFNHTAPFPE